jgi:hypothetical protein
MEFISENIISEGNLSGQTLNVTHASITNLNVINFTGGTDFYVTGGTYSNGTLTLNRQNGSINIPGFFTGGTVNDTYITGFTYSNNNLTISQNGGSSPLTVTINTMTALTINGEFIVNDGATVDNFRVRSGATMSNVAITNASITGLTVSGTLTIPNSPVSGYILTSNGSGVATWQQSPLAGSGSTKFDLQVVTGNTSVTSTSASSAWVDVGSMSITAKNLTSSATTYVLDFSCTAALSSNTGSGNFRIVLNGIPITGSNRARTNAGAAMAATNIPISTNAYVTNIKSGDIFKVQFNSPAGQWTVTDRSFIIMGVLTINVV